MTETGRVRWYRTMVFKMAGLMVISILAFTGVTMYLQDSRQKYFYFVESLDNRIKQTVTLRQSISDAMVAGNIINNTIPIDRFMAQNPDIAYLCVTGPKEVLLSSTVSDGGVRTCPDIPVLNEIPAYSNNAVNVSRVGWKQNNVSYVDIEVFSDPEKHQYGSLRVGWYDMKAVKAEQFRKVIQLERYIADGVLKMIEAMDYTGIDHVSKQMSGRDTNIRYIIVTDGGFQVLSHPDQDKKFQKLEDPLSLNAEKTGPYNPILIQNTKLNGEDIMDVSLGLFGGGENKERLCNVRIGYSLRDQQQRAKSSTKRMAAIAAILILLIIISSVITARRIAAPVLSLAGIARKVGGGDLETNVKYRSGGDEIRLLFDSFNQMIAGLRERDLVKDTFSRYVTKQVAEEILKHPDRIAPGGKKQEVTVLFSDIRGFTTFSENHSPEEVLAHLNEYLSTMINVIFKYEGTLDKFIGDAIMAVFGSPIAHEDDPVRAVKTALEMQTKLQELNEKWKKQNKEQLAIGIGVNTGDVIVGNIGDMRRMEYTVIGDNVNIASRIESLTKELHCPIIISKNTYEKVKDSVEVHELEAVQMKGKTRTVVLYELLGLKQ